MKLTITLTSLLLLSFFTSCGTRTTVAQRNTTPVVGPERVDNSGLKFMGTMWASLY